VRLLTFALPVVAGPLIALHALLEPYRAAGGKQPAAAAGPVTHALHHAVGPALLGVGVALGVAAALVAVDRRLRIGTGAVHRINRVAVAVAVLLALGGVAGGLAATHGDPGGRISHAWNDFKDFKRADRPGQSHLTSLGSSRYDFWRVSLDIVGDHPLAGLGQDNFANAYLVRRQSLEEPRWTHSLELRLLVHTGIVGLLLFMTFLGALVWAGLRAVRGSPAARLATGVALLPVADWVLHGSVDWLWEYPALSVAALAFAAMAVAVGEPSGRPPWPPGRTGRRVLAVAGGLGAVAAAVALACGWIAAWGLDRAATQWAGNPALAMRRLDRAAELNPLDHQVPLVRGLIEELRGEHLRAISSLREAADDVPGDWFPRFELGLIRANSSARDDLLAARARNPREELVGVALRRLGTRHPLTIAQAATIFRNRVDRRLARPAHRRATN